jgi:hypothetical protein
MSSANNFNLGACILSFVITALIAVTIGAAGALILGLIIFYIISIPATLLTSGAAAYGNGVAIITVASIALTAAVYIALFYVVWRYIYNILNKAH